MRPIQPLNIREAIMKPESFFAVILAVLAPCLAAVGQTAPQPVAAPTAPMAAPESPATNAIAGEEVADVLLEDVSLPDAIRSLARQANLNIEFDPKLLNATGPDGRPILPPTVSEKWRQITATQALQALLDNYGWQMVMDPRTKIGRITAKDSAALEPLVVAVFPLRYANTTNMVTLVRDTLSQRSTIFPDVRTHQLIVRTTERELPGVEALIAKLDSATRQVLVEAKIIQTSKDINSAKGVDWTGTLAAQHVSFGNGLTSGTSVNASTANSSSGASTGTVSPGGAPISGSGASPVNTLISSNVTSLTTSILGSTSAGGGFTANTSKGISPATAFLNADGLQAVLSFLNTDTDTKTIASPRGVALDGTPTELMVIQNIPILEQTQSAPASGASQGLATVQPNYDKSVAGTILNEVGVKLTVTPRIAGPTNVLLELVPEISQQQGEVSQTLNGQNNTAPSFSRTRIKTSASVPSGYTLVLGGLDQDVTTKALTKVPFLGDLPGLGNLFSSANKTHTKQTILIFVTPTIVRDQDYQPSESKFLKRKQESPSGIDEPPWDTAEPYDWTKPKDNGIVPEYKP